MVYYQKKEKGKIEEIEYGTHSFTFDFTHIMNGLEPDEGLLSTVKKVSLQHCPIKSACFIFEVTDSNDYYKIYKDNSDPTFSLLDVISSAIPKECMKNEGVFSTMWRKINSGEKKKLKLYLKF